MPRLHLCLPKPVASGLNDPTSGYLPCRSLSNCHLSGWLLSPLCSFYVTMVTFPQPALLCGSRWTSDSCPGEQAPWFHFVLPPAHHRCFIKDDHFWESVHVRLPIKLSVPYIMSSRSSFFTLCLQLSPCFTQINREWNISKMHSFNYQAANFEDYASALLAGLRTSLLYPPESLSCCP